MERTKAYSYQDIAAGFQHRIMAPFIVTVEPTESDSQITLNTHLGQEFNYILEGELEISIAGKVNVLYPATASCLTHAVPTDCEPWEESV